MTELEAIYHSGDVTQLKGLKLYQVYQLLAIAYNHGYQRGRSDELVALLSLREEADDG